MQNAAAMMAPSLAHMADDAVGFIHQNQRVGIWGNIVGTEREATNLVHLRNSADEHPYTESGRVRLASPTASAVFAASRPCVHHNWL
jgi:hypothetical protein